MHIILSFFPPLLAAHDNSYSHFLFNESAQLYKILSECEKQVVSQIFSEPIVANFLVL